MNRNYELANKIRELLPLNLTQKEAAKRLGCTPSNISITCRVHGIQWNNQRRDQWGDKNHSYKNGMGRSTIERATRRVVLSIDKSLLICERCGYIDCTRQELPRHHRDRDRTNNDSNNIEVLCWSCHNIEHMNEQIRDSGGRFVKK